VKTGLRKQAAPAANRGAYASISGFDEYGLPANMPDGALAGDWEWFGVGRRFTRLMGRY